MKDASHSVSSGRDLTEGAQARPSAGVPGDGEAVPRLHAGLRVLFLDVDGVLNSHRTILTTGNCAHPHNYNERREMFDWTAIKMLQGLCRAGGIQVVLSSSWRCGMDPEALGKFGGFLGLPIIDMTPQAWQPHQRRGHEIKGWLDNHAEVTHYAIVDDDSDMLPEQRPQFVQTFYEDGLTFAPFSKLCDIFGVSVWDCGQRAAERGAALTDPNQLSVNARSALTVGARSDEQNPSADEQKAASVGSAKGMA